MGAIGSARQIILGLSGLFLAVYSPILHAQSQPEGSSGLSGGVQPTAFGTCSNGLPPTEIPAPPPPAPSKFAASPGGVDMHSGTFSWSNTDLSIGGGEGAGLNLTRNFSYMDEWGNYRQSFGQYFTHNWDIELREVRLAMPGTCYPSERHYSMMVMYGGLGASFRSPDTPVNFKQTAPVGYATLTYSGTPNNGNVTYTYTARDGTIILFRPLKPMTQNTDCSNSAVDTRCAYASKITQPDGTIYTLEYDTGGNGIPVRLRSVTSNRGVALLLEYAAPAGDYNKITKACVLNLAVQPKPDNNVCPAGVPTATYSYTGVALTSATDAGGGVHGFTLGANQFSMTRPGETTPWVTNNFSLIGGTYPPYNLTITSQNFLVGSGYSYSWTTMTNTGDEGNRTEVVGGSWTDGNGKSVSLAYGQYVSGLNNDFSTLYATPGPKSITDQLGNVTTANYCGTIANGGTCIIPPQQSVTDAEGIKEAYTYDAYRNITQSRRTAKPGSGLTDIVTSKAFGSAYATSRAKPTSTTDGNGNVTSYSYDPVHGGVLTETSPALGGIAPVKRYAYVQRYAWIRNSANTGYIQSATPIWVLSEERFCRTSATTGNACAGGAADEVVSTYDYGPNSGPNNLQLRGVAVTSEGITLRTCYGYDSYARKVSETKPMANLGACP